MIQAGPHLFIDLWTLHKAILACFPQSLCCVVTDLGKTGLIESGPPSFGLEVDLFKSKFGTYIAVAAFLRPHISDLKVFKNVVSVLGH